MALIPVEAIYALQILSMLYLYAKYYFFRPFIVTWKVFDRQTRMEGYCTVVLRFGDLLAQEEVTNTVTFILFDPFSMKR